MLHVGVAVEYPILVNIDVLFLGTEVRRHHLTIMVGYCSCVLGIQYIIRTIHILYTQYLCIAIVQWSIKYCYYRCMWEQAVHYHQNCCTVIATEQEVECMPGPLHHENGVSLLGLYMGSWVRSN